MSHSKTWKERKGEKGTKDMDNEEIGAKIRRLNGIEIEDMGKKNRRKYV